MVGAGAAGLTAALRAAQAGAQVSLLNAHPRIGLKILMSGGTRCNVTHEVVTERDFNGGSRPFVRRVLSQFDVASTVAWMQELGVELKLEPTGKYFPVTDDAQTVLDALVGAVGRTGVRVESGARVIRIERAPGCFRLAIQAVRDSSAFGVSEVARPRETTWPLPSREPDRWVEADRIILAAGGLSFPRTGSDGTGYALVTSLGHTLEPPIPALTPLASEDPWCRELQGLAVEAELRLFVARERLTSMRGSLLFAHFGYSGPAALDLSRHWLRAGEDGGVRRVLASFLPGDSDEAVSRWLVERAAAEPRVAVRSVLARRLPDRLAAALCRETGADPATPLGQLTRVARTRLVEVTLARPTPVTGTLGYEKAEVTAGGVRLAEVDPRTLESRVAPGVYLCGEILDVDGRLGGFNFQFSWSSGTVAGRAAAST